LGLRKLHRQREAAAQGAEPPDGRGDRHLRPASAHLQGEPGPEEDHERRQPRVDGRRRGGGVSTRGRPCGPVEVPDRLYFKIGEVAKLVGVKPYVLRCWKTAYSAPRPCKTRPRPRPARR